MLGNLAKVIRVITIPPIMVGGLLTVLYFVKGASVFPTSLDYFLALLFLALIPVLAYPFQKLIPILNRGGRRIQRNLAFVFSFLGYSGAVVTSILRDAIPNLLFISVVYFISVVILTLINCLTPWHASGHACSLMGPILLVCLFIGWYAVPVGVVLYVASLWASIYMKRHTVKEFLLGSLSSGFASLIAYFIAHPVF